MRSLICSIVVVVFAAACGDSTPESSPPNPTPTNNNESAGSNNSNGSNNSPSQSTATPEIDNSCAASSSPPSSIPPLVPGSVVDVAMPQPLVVDLVKCSPARYTMSLANNHGDVWIQVGSTHEGVCELWYGGQTTKPTTDGSASQYCSFKKECSANPAGTVTVSATDDIGPARLIHPGCTPG